MSNAELRQNINTLQEEIPMLDNQLEIVDEFLENNAFEDTVPEFQGVISAVETYKAAVERYKEQAEQKIEEWTAELNRASAPAQAAAPATMPIPAGCPLTGDAATQGVVQLVSGLLQIMANAAKQ